MSRQPHDDLIGNDLAENYRAILDDPNRKQTTKRLAKWAEQHNDAALAQWAHAEGEHRKTTNAAQADEPSSAGEQRAASVAAGADATPTAATAEPTADAAPKTPRATRGKGGAKQTAEDAAAERAAAEAVISDSLDDQLSPPAENTK